MDIVLNKIVQLLNNHNVTYELKEHAPAYTSLESALARGESIDVGAKALLIKGDENYTLFVISAGLKLDSKKAKTSTGVRKIRFATREELFELTGLLPGSVPPYGEPILPFKLIIDSSLTKLPYVAFNAGSLEKSIKLSVSDYLQTANGEVREIT